MNFRKFLGITPEVIEALNETGMVSPRKLAEMANVLQDSAELAEMLNVEDEVLQNLLSHAELLNLDGIGFIYSDLLVSTGIRSLSQLSDCDPYNLHETILQAAKKKAVGRVPNRATVEYWIEQARELSSNKGS